MKRDKWMNTAGGAADDQLHRRYVGPVERWPISAAHQLSVVQAEGVSKSSVLVDLGCGPLCAGSVLIPWLEVGHYFGVEPNAEALAEGIKREGFAQMIADRQATLNIGSCLALPALVDDGKVPSHPDLVLMHSIFSHMRPGLLAESLTAMHDAFDRGTKVLASFALVKDSANVTATTVGDPWEYPGLIHYTHGLAAGIAAENGWTLVWRKYREPGKQVWASLTAE